MKDSGPDNQEMINKLKQVLDKQELDKDIQQRLSNARYQALQQPQPSFSSRYATPMVAFASICALAIAITLSLTPVEKPTGIDNIETFEIFTSNDSLEMYENLEFYLWLDEEMNV